MAKLVTSDGVQVNLFLDLDSHNTGEGTLLYGPKSQAEMDFIVKGFRNFKTNSEYNNKNRLEFHCTHLIEVDISSLMSANPTISNQYTVPNHSDTKLYFVEDDLILSKTGSKIHRIDLFKSASANTVTSVNGNSPDVNGNVTVTVTGGGGGFSAGQYFYSEDQNLPSDTFLKIEGETKDITHPAFFEGFRSFNTLTQTWEEEENFLNSPMKSPFDSLAGNIHLHSFPCAVKGDYIYGIFFLHSEYKFLKYDTIQKSWSDGNPEYSNFNGVTTDGNYGGYAPSHEIYANGIDQTNITYYLPTSHSNSKIPNFSDYLWSNTRLFGYNHPSFSYRNHSLGTKLITVGEHIYAITISGSLLIKRFNPNGPVFERHIMENGDTDLAGPRQGQFEGAVPPWDFPSSDEVDGESIFMGNFIYSYKEDGGFDYLMSEYGKTDADVRFFEVCTDNVDCIFILGGFGRDSKHPHFIMRYDISTNSIKIVGKLPHGLYGFNSFVKGKDLIISGGRNPADGSFNNKFFILRNCVPSATPSEDLLFDTTRTEVWRIPLNLWENGIGYIQSEGIKLPKLETDQSDQDYNLNQWKTTLPIGSNVTDDSRGIEFEILGYAEYNSSSVAGVILVKPVSEYDYSNIIPETLTSSNFKYSYTPSRRPVFRFGPQSNYTQISNPMQLSWYADYVNQKKSENPEAYPTWQTVRYHTPQATVYADFTMSSQSLGFTGFPITISSEVSEIGSMWIGPNVNGVFDYSFESPQAYATKNVPLVEELGQSQYPHHFAYSFYDGNNLWVIGGLTGDSSDPVLTTVQQNSTDKIPLVNSVGSLSNKVIKYSFDGGGVTSESDESWNMPIASASASFSVVNGKVYIFYGITPQFILENPSAFHETTLKFASDIYTPAENKTLQFYKTIKGE